MTTVGNFVAVSSTDYGVVSAGLCDKESVMTDADLNKHIHRMEYSVIIFHLATLLKPKERYSGFEVHSRIRF
jgi:hypothetical protein